MQGTGKFCVFIAAFIFICPICHCLLDTVTGLLGGSNNNGNTDNENVEKNTGGSTASTACSPPEGYTDNIDGFSYRDYGETLNYWKAMSTCHKNRARLPLFKGEAMYNTIKGILPEQIKASPEQRALKRRGKKQGMNKHGGRSLIAGKKHTLTDPTDCVGSHRGPHARTGSHLATSKGRSMTRAGVAKLMSQSTVNRSILSEFPKHQGITTVFDRFKGLSIMQTGPGESLANGGHTRESICRKIGSPTSMHHCNLSYTVGLLANVNETRAQAIPANEALRFLKWNDGTTPLDLQFMTETIIFDEGEMCMTIFKDKHLSDTPCRNRTHTFCQFPCADEGKEQRNQW
eukprot:TCALIF_12153-PA protein Name:"Protein of unknown function" AED:0.18 eAED:0.18 QI:0/0.33/0.28/0.57/0.66/0.85/7/105/344